MSLLRTIIFYVLVLAYLIICPLIILRMLGFIMDPKTHHWVKTGIIYVSSNPPDAHIFLNDHHVPETTPTIIRDLTPGNYVIRLELDGYEAWENTLPVLDKKATSVENILLIPKQWKIKAISDVPFTKILPLPGNNYLLASMDDTIRDLFILRLNKNIENNAENEKISSSELKPLFPEESIYNSALVLGSFTIDKSPFLILSIIHQGKQKYLWIDPRDEGQVHIEDISELLPEAPTRLFWEPNDDKNIFAFYPSSVNRLNIKEKAIYPNIQDKDIPKEKVTTELLGLPKADQIFLANNKNTVIFRRGGYIFLMDKEGFGKPRLINILRVMDNTDVYFTEKTGRLYYIDEQTKLLSSAQILHHRAFIPKPIANTLRLEKLKQ